MNDDLRTRIAAALLGDHCVQGMTATCDDCRAHALRQADAVIRELDMGIPCATDGCRMRQIARRSAEKLGLTGDGE